MRYLRHNPAQIWWPHYLKIDIEGAEPCCLKHLWATNLPEYIALEAESFECLVQLQQLGYKQFKIVDQMRHNSKFPNFSNNYVFSRSAKRICWFADRAKNRLGRVTFPRGSSGPFGEETPGEWQTFDEVASDWQHLCLGHHNSGTLNPHSWYDFHAKASRPPQFSGAYIDAREISITAGCI